MGFQYGQIQQLQLNKTFGIAGKWRNLGLKKVIAAHLEKRVDSGEDVGAQRMKVVIYGGRGWVGKQVQDLLAARNLPFEVIYFQKIFSWIFKVLLVIRAFNW